MAGEFFVMVSLGVACLVIAKGRGRSPGVWFGIGFLLNVAGLILLLVLPDLSVEDPRWKGARKETRRVRERLLKDRQVADRRFEETERRLAVHDRSLGLDTGVPEALGAAPGQPPPLPPGPRGDGPSALEGEWFFARDGKPIGPLGLDELRWLADEGGVTPATLVWSELLVDWKVAREVDGLLEGQAV